MRFLYCYFLILVALMSVVETTYGQEWKVAQRKYRFHRLNTKHGLANEFAYSIAQDSLGFIWVEYYGGLSRYDGYNFKIYKHNPTYSGTKGLDFVLWGLVTDRDKGLWVVGHPYLNAADILARRDNQTGEIIKHLLPADASVNGSRVFDRDGTIWFAGAPDRFYQYDTRRETTSRFNIHTGNEANGYRNEVTGVHDRDTALLLATADGLWIFNKNLKSVKRPECRPSDTTLLYHSYIARILDSPNWNERNTWMVSKQGDIPRQDLVPQSQPRLIELDSVFNILRTVSLPHGIRVTQCARDHNGVFWFGAGTGGLSTYDPRTGNYQHLVHDPMDPWSLPSDDLLHVLVDRDNNVWVGTDRGIGVLKRKDLEFYNFNLGQGVGNSTMFEARGQEYLLLAKMEGVESLRRIYRVSLDRNSIDSIRLIDTKLFSDNGNSSFLYQGRKHLWTTLHAGTQDAQIVGYPIEPRTGFPDEKIPTILHYDPTNRNKLNNQPGFLWEDSRGNIFVSATEGLEIIRSGIQYGTEGAVVHLNVPTRGRHYPESDLSFWLRNTNSLELFSLTNSLDTGTIESVLDVGAGVMAIHRSRDSTIYVGTSNGLYTGKGRSGTYGFRRHPLVKGTVIRIQVDDQGRIWLFGDNKLTCYDIDKGQLTTFGELDGVDHFQEHRAAQGTQSLNYSRDGIMCLASPDGLTLFDPSTFSFSNKAVIPVFTALEINNSPVDGQRVRGDSTYLIPTDVGVLQELELDYLHNNFGIEFSSMELTAPEKNVYRHMLDGYDKNWIETDYKNRNASYTNLPAGTYIFRVKASNHHGVWSDKERTLNVIILPPPWRTWWAYTGYWALGIGLLVLARRTIVQRERLKANLNLARVEQEKEHFELEKAKEVDRVKTSFFTNISHEFRTPLTLIKGPVDAMLERYQDDAEAVKRLKLVQRNSELLLRLINQLLDLAKLESGNLKVESSPGEAHGFVRAVASSFESHARQKGVTLRVEVPQEPAPVMFDKDKLETIVINLVNNAIKFTPSGGLVTVIANSKRQTPNSNKYNLSIAVKDTGIGIPADELERIFERFHQVSESHKEVGTGIGLALVKELVALMGGTIQVESETGKGCTFAVTLPLEPVEIAQPEHQTNGAERTTDYPDYMRHSVGAGRSPRAESLVPSTNGTDSSKPQILVVEDNFDVRGFIIDSLGEQYVYIEAENGKQGLEKAAEEIPDLIISDVMMPEMDGIEMAARIKLDRNTSHIPLIILTAKSTEESKLSGLSSGADDYLTKPFNKQELLLKVRNSINRQTKLKEKLRNELLTEPPAEKVLSQDEQFLQKVKETIIERMSDEQLSVESLADDMGMSRVQLYRKVSALTGLAANELIRKLRMQRAAQLLGQNWGPVSQVAYEVGFSNLSYFSKVFKEEFGVLPSEYVA